MQSKKYSYLYRKIEMMDTIIKSAVEAVGELNDLFFGEIGPDEYLPFEVKYAGWRTTIVTFMGVCIWNEEDDLRVFSEENNDYEPLKGFLIRRSQEVIEDLNSKMKNLLEP